MGLLGLTACEFSVLLKHGQLWHVTMEFLWQHVTSGVFGSLEVAGDFNRGGETVTLHVVFIYSYIPGAPQESK